MELRNLKTFLEVAERMSFNRAAQALNYAQSTVSAHIQALEERLDARLFERLGRRVTLTDAGGRLLEYARKFVELEEEAAAEVTAAGEARGTLTIRVPESLSAWRFPKAVQEFHQSYPRVNLTFTTCALHGLEDDLRRGVTDLALLLYDSVSASGLDSEILATEDLVLAAPAGHPLAGRTKLTASDLDGETLLFSTSDCSYRKLLEAQLSHAGAEPSSIMEFGSVHALARTVASGAGIAPMPGFLADVYARHGSVAALPWPDGPLETGVLMLWHKEKWMSPVLAAFMDAVRREFRQN